MGGLRHDDDSDEEEGVDEDEDDDDENIDQDDEDEESDHNFWSIRNTLSSILVYSILNFNL